jgi:hypothetical protein
MMLNGGKIKEVSVSTFLSSRAEMQKVIETARQTSINYMTLAQPAPVVSVVPQIPVQQPKPVQPQPPVISLSGFLSQNMSSDIPGLTLTSSPVPATTLSQSQPSADFLNSYQSQSAPAFQSNLTSSRFKSLQSNAENLNDNYRDGYGRSIDSKSRRDRDRSKRTSSSRSRSRERRRRDRSRSRDNRRRRDRRDSRDSRERDRRRDRRDRRSKSKDRDRERDKNRSSNRDKDDDRRGRSSSIKDQSTQPVASRDVRNKLPVEVPAKEDNLQPAKAVTNVWDIPLKPAGYVHSMLPTLNLLPTTVEAPKILDPIMQQMPPMLQHQKPFEQPKLQPQPSLMHLMSNTSLTNTFNKPFNDVNVDITKPLILKTNPSIYDRPPTLQPPNQYSPEAVNRLQQLTSQRNPNAFQNDAQIVNPQIGGFTSANAFNSPNQGGNMNDNFNNNLRGNNFNNNFRSDFNNQQSNSYNSMGGGSNNNDNSRDFSGMNDSDIFIYDEEDEDIMAKPQQQKRDFSNDRQQQQKRDISNDRQQQRNNSNDRQQQQTRDTSHDQGIAIDETAGLSVKLSNLDERTGYGEIRRFFQGFFIGNSGIKMINDSQGHRTGVAMLQFARNDVKRNALMRSGGELKGRNVIISQITDEEFLRAIDSFRPSFRRNDMDNENRRNNDNDDDFNRERTYRDRSPIRNQRSNDFRDRRNNNEDDDDRMEIVDDDEREPSVEIVSPTDLQTTLVLTDLPNFAQERDIIKIFSDYTLMQIIMLRTDDWKKQYQSYVKFHRAEDTAAALKNKALHFIGHKSIYVARCSNIDFEEAKNKYCPDIPMSNNSQGGGLENNLVEANTLRLELPNETRQPPSLLDQNVFSNNQIGNKQTPIQKIFDTQKGAFGNTSNNSFAQPNRNEQNSNCIIMSNLNPMTNERDVLDFFSDIGIIPTKIHILRNKYKKPSGDCICEFPIVNDAASAMAKDGFHLGRNRVTLKFIAKNRVNEILSVDFLESDSENEKRQQQIQQSQKKLQVSS